MGRLEEMPDAVAKAGDPKPSSALGDLVDEVMVWQDPEVKGGVEVEISGCLNALLGTEAYPTKVRAIGDLVVAKDRYIKRPTQAEPTFPFRAKAA